MRTAFTELVGIDAPLVGFNRSPGVVTAVSRAGGLGVLAATAYRPEELDAQLTWIEEQLDGRPYGVDLLVPAATVSGDPHYLRPACRRRSPTSTSASWSGCSSARDRSRPLAKDAWALIDEAAAGGGEGARELESFFIGQVVGAFGELVPAAEIVRTMLEGCERRIAELAALATERNSE